MVFLGSGRAADMHSRTLRRLDRSAVQLSYASRDGKNAAALAKRHDGAESYTSYAAALDDPSIRIAFVTTPPASHLMLTLSALAANKDVIVEKPAFLNTGDFTTVREAMSTSTGRVFVAENYFYKPLRRRLSRILEEDLIGEPLLLEVNAVKHQSPGGWRADPELTGGGGFFEGGIHWINLMASLGMDVKTATGQRAGAGGGGGAESVAAVLTYAGGAVGTLLFSWEVPSPLKGIRTSRIYGRKGSVVFESNGIFVFVRGTKTRLHFPGTRDIAGYRGMFTDILDAIRYGREPAMTLAMAERDVSLVRQIYRSMEES